MTDQAESLPYARFRMGLPRPIGVRRGGLAVAAMLAAVGLLFVWQASLLDFGSVGLPGAGFFPLTLGAVLAAFAGVIAGERWRQSAAGETVELGHRDVLICVAAMLFVPLLFESLGAYITLGLFGTTLLVGIGRISPPLAAAAAAIAMAACWYFFQVLLGLQLPGGPF
jgi:putative tricarboxylic transport membrane protein